MKFSWYPEKRFEKIHDALDKYYSYSTRTVLALCRELHCCSFPRFVERRRRRRAPEFQSFIKNLSEKAEHVHIDIFTYLWKVLRLSL
jgi:N-glycosylase/DNA lyase